jgi:hypothetical protein
MKIRLYRFYNMGSSEYGEPFALCDDCKPKQVVPEMCILNVIANEALWACALCGREGEA